MTVAGAVLRWLPLAFLATFFGYPLASILWRGLGGGDPWDTWSSSTLWDVAWFTTWQAVLSTVVTVVAALPAAWVLAHRRFAGAAAVRAAIIVPFVLPTVVVANAFTALERLLELDGGPPRRAGSVVAIIAAHAFFNYAIVVRTVSTVWRRLDPAIEEEARMLGASAWRTFRQITLPRLMPALAGSGAIVFLFCFTSFGVVLLLGGPRRATLDTEIWRYTIQRGELDTAAAIAVVQLVAVLAAIGLNVVLQRRYIVTEAHPRDRSRRARPGRERRVQAAALASMALIVGGPIVALVERSLRVGDGYGLRWYRELFADELRPGTLPQSATQAVVNSLSIAVVATVIATVVGVAAVLVARRRDAVGTVTEIAFLVPLGASGVLLGLGFLIALDEPPLDLRTSWIIMPLAHALVGLPFVLRSVGPVLAGIDPRLREAAATLGASPLRVWREVDLPMMRRAALVGAGFAFAVSLGEFGATAFISRPNRLTMPVAIFRLLSRPGDVTQRQAMAMSVVLMVLTAAAVLVVERLRPRNADGW